MFDKVLVERLNDLEQIAVEIRAQADASVNDKEREHRLRNAAFKLQTGVDVIRIAQSDLQNL